MAVASGLALRHDGGPCFRSEHYQVEIRHLGIARLPTYHYESETNGCAEKFIRTLKEQVLWIERFETRPTGPNNGRGNFPSMRAALARGTHPDPGCPKKPFVGLGGRRRVLAWRSVPASLRRSGVGA